MNLDTFTVLVELGDCVGIALIHLIPFLRQLLSTSQDMQEVPVAKLFWCKVKLLLQRFTF